jgi:hypothetical protein
MFHLGLAALVVVSWAFAGCKPSGPKLYPVSGTVTYNGQPIPEGTIILLTPGEVDESTNIANGRFSLQARPGHKRVKILASKADGPVDPQMGVPPLRQYIPARYSSEDTELSLDVNESGKKRIYSFDLVDEPQP